MTDLEPPSGLRCDYRVDPIGVDRAPLLSWEPGARQEEADVEVVADDLATSTLSSGREPRLELPIGLAPFTPYRWRVRTRRGPDASRWSAWAAFDTGPLDESDWGASIWIGAGGPGPAPVLSCLVDIVGNTGPLRLYASGLGSVEMRINGERVGDGVLDPPPSAYDDVVFFRSFDVSGLVRQGRNVLEARLGRGFYAMTSPTDFGWHRAPWRDEPKLRALLVDLRSPSAPLLASGPGWTAIRSTVLDDSYYTGEVIDVDAPATSGPAVVVAPPGGRLLAARQPPVTRRGRVAISGRSWTGSDRQRIDLTQNVAGMVAVESSAPAAELLVKLGEHLGDAGEVVARDGAIPGDLQRSRILGIREHERVALDLTYAGLRYVEITGTRTEVEVEVDRVSSAPEPVSAFRSTDPRLDAIHAVARRTFENCLQGTPIDTPLYEKQGYTGDAQLLAESYAYTFWMPTALGDWYTASVLPMQGDDGSMPGIAPTPPGNWIFDVPSPAWDAALFEIPATLLRHYADDATLRRAVPAMRDYLEFLRRRYPSGVVDTGLGDWNPPGRIEPPEAPGLLSTAYHYRFLRQFAGFLRRLGEAGEAGAYDIRAEGVRSAFDATFWRDGYYGAVGDGYRETANVLVLAFELAPAARRSSVLSRVVSELEARDRHLDTGIVGTRFLLRTLAAAGRSDLAFSVARQDTYPGWGFWLANGATTLYENWELDGRSHDHAMFGSIVEWMHADVAGISPAAEGWGAIRVVPRLPGEPGFGCAAEMQTLAGPIAAEWDDRGTTIRGRVTAPAGVPLVVPEGAERRVTRHVETPRGREVEHALDLEVRPRA